MSHFYPDIHERRILVECGRMKHFIVSESVPLKAEVAVTKEPVPYEKRLELKYRPIKRGEHWGNTWDCAWFHITGTVPKSWKGEYVTLNLEFGGELLVFDNKGCPLVGLTNGSVFDAEYSKDHLHFLKSAKGGEKIDLWVDAGSNNLFGVGREEDPDFEENPDLKDGKWFSSVNKLAVCRFNYELWQLRLDIGVLVSLYETMPQNSGRRIRIVRAISHALDILPEEIGGVAAARKYLKDTIYSIGPDPASIHVTAIGHAHIDTAWLWPVRETKRKVARTFSSQIGLIERYPGYKFGASQPQLYKYCKEDYPKLYAKIKKAVANGDWELQGGMWVEPDCNIPSGESLVRQFLYGMRFYKEEFGKVPRNLWIPDVFGYSGNLPQIMRICGIEFFITQKLSWNRYNKFPHNTFVWEGIDGSRVVTHFPPEDTYNSNMAPNELVRHENNNREAGIIDEAVSLFGIGDGGGGPKEEYIERGLRCRNLNGCPRVEFGFAQDAFDRMAQHEEELDIWRGELYFEMHRGTYTTQCMHKLLNRRAEETLRTAEMLAAISGKYPMTRLTELWHDVLLGHFHDFMAGSCIARVYKEGAVMLQNVIDAAHAIAQDAGRSLLRKSAGSLTLFNPSSTEYRGAIALPEGWTAANDADGAPLAAQLEDGKVFASVVVPPCSFSTFTKAERRAVAVKKGRGLVLENDLVRYEFDGDLHIVSAYDKTADVEFITERAPGNLLSLFDDHPSAYDAWDVEEYSYDMQLDTPHVKTVSLVNGSVRSTITASFKLGKSTFTQKIKLEAGSKRLDFETTADWKESHRLCRVAFPVTVRSDNASFEIQYGTISRATHDNTKWQYAQFESCAQRYADLSDNGFGVALLNDCKYGYRVKGSVLSMSLLRAPTTPDPYADKGIQHFTYSILPHEGTLADSDEVTTNAAILNQGVERFEGYAATERAVLPVTFDGEGVELAVIKKAEYSEDIIVRLVERRGNHAFGILRTAFKNAKITPCLATELADTGDSLAAPACIKLRPFEIATFRISKS